jgi:ribonuclease HII
MARPDFSFEKKYWRIGYYPVIGVDEVGRGAFAGPLIAAAAAMKIFNFQFLIFNEREKIINEILKLGINDSKKLSPKKRKKLEKIVKKYFYTGIGESSVSEINRLGIVKATEKAMRRALRLVALAQGKQLKGKRFVLIDAFHVKYIPGVGLRNQKAIVHGDSKSISIAAASIIAKVYRDSLMRRLSKKYDHYH